MSSTTESADATTESTTAATESTTAATESTTAAKPVTHVNPRPFLSDLVGKEIVVQLKWGMEFKGTLERADLYMNLMMSDVKEYVGGNKHNEINELLIRCNNVLFIRALKEGEPF